MNKIKIIGTCIILLLIINIVFAERFHGDDIDKLKSYETTGLSRMVSDSPSGMIKQLNKPVSNLRHTTYMGDLGPSKGSPITKGEILKKSFNDNVNIMKDPRFLNSELEPTSKWDLRLDDDDIDLFKDDELIIFEGFTHFESGNEMKLLETAKATETYVYELRYPLQEKGGLFILDSSYAGLYLPKQPSLIARIVDHTPVMAPTSYPSREIIKSIICNLGKYDNLGEVFRQARNNYYWGIDTEDEYVGLTLLSYMLYGDANTKVYIPYYDEEEIQGYCRNYLDQFPQHGTDLMFSIMGPDSEPLEPVPYTGKFTFQIPKYQIKEKDNFSILNAEFMSQNYKHRELFLPKQIISHKYPDKTIIQDMKLLSLEDPVEITIPNIPMWEGEIIDDTPKGKLIKRECYFDQSDAGIDFAHSYTENEEVVLVTINPVEVVDCEQGIFKLYQKVTYDIDYLPYSDVLIDELNYKKYVAPEEETTLEVKLQNIKSMGVYGKLIVTDENNNIVGKTFTHLHTAEGNLFEIQFNAGNERGIKKYKVEYFDDETPTTYNEFELNIDTLVFDQVTPEKIDYEQENIPTTIIIDNRLETTEVHIKTSIYPKDNPEDIKEIMQEDLSVDNGITIKTYNLDYEVEDYGNIIIKTELTYEDKTLTQESQTLLAKTDENVAPEIIQAEDITIKEGEIARPNIKVRDLNGDVLTINYGYPIGNDGIWLTEIDDQGTYDIPIKVSDGIIDTETIIQINVLPHDGKIEKFSDKEQEKIVQFYQPQKKTIYVKIPKNSQVNNFDLMVEGYNSAYENE